MKNSKKELDVKNLDNVAGGLIPPADSSANTTYLYLYEITPGNTCSGQFFAKNDDEARKKIYGYRDNHGWKIIRLYIRPSLGTEKDIPF